LSIHQNVCKNVSVKQLKYTNPHCTVVKYSAHLRITTFYNITTSSCIKFQYNIIFSYF